MTLEEGLLYDFFFLDSTLWLSPPGPGVCFIYLFIFVSPLSEWPCLVPRPHCPLTRAASTELEVHPSTAVGLGWLSWPAPARLCPLGEGETSALRGAPQRPSWPRPQGPRTAVGGRQRRGSPGAELSPGTGPDPAASQTPTVAEGAGPSCLGLFYPERNAERERLGDEVLD